MAPIGGRGACQPPVTRLKYTFVCNFCVSSVENGPIAGIAVVKIIYVRPDATNMVYAHPVRTDTEENKAKLKTVGLLQIKIDLLDIFQSRSLSTRRHSIK